MSLTSEAEKRVLLGVGEERAIARVLMALLVTEMSAAWCSGENNSVSVDGPFFIVTEK